MARMTALETLSRRSMAQRKVFKNQRNGPSDEQGDAFGTGEADSLRNQFADHHVQNRLKG